MKQLLLIVSFALLSAQALAETRTIAISCKAIVEKDANGAQTIKGHLYSLRTGVKSEEAVDVPLKDILEKLPKVKYADSVMEVFIFAENGISTESLISILQVIKKQPVMELVHLQNGILGKRAESVKKHYKL